MPDTTANTEHLKSVRIILLLSCILTTVVSAGFVLLGFNTVSPVYLTGLPVLRIIHAVLTVVIVVTSNYIAKKILSGKIKLKSRPPSSESGIRISPFFQLYLVSTIVQIALIESMALFGAVIFFYAASTAVLRMDPTYYLHFLPLLLFFGWAIKLYPTEQKVSDLENLYSAQS